MTGPLIKVVPTRGLVRELQGIHVQLERLAEMFELYLNMQNMFIPPRVGDKEEEGEELMYRDERQAVLQELAEALRLQKGAEKREDGEE